MDRLLQCCVCNSEPEDSVKTSSQVRKLGLVVSPSKQCPRLNARWPASSASQPLCKCAVISCSLAFAQGRVPRIFTVRFCALQVCRGTAVMMVSPTSGTEEIANPFSNAEDGDEEEG